MLSERTLEEAKVKLLELIAGKEVETYVRLSSAYIWIDIVDLVRKEQRLMTLDIASDSLEID